MASIIGLIVGYFCVRLRGIYFAILTLAFGQLLFFVIYKWHNFTGGDDGIQGVFPPGLLKSPINLLLFCSSLSSSSRLMSYGELLILPLAIPLDRCVKIQKELNS